MMNTMKNKKLSVEELAMVNGGIREEKPKGPFTCKVCGREFLTITSIACHCSAEHHY